MIGSVIIMQNVPENTEVGIDMKFWRVGKIFRGIKDIPNGFHYVYYSAVNSDCKSGQRRGFCEWFIEPRFVVKRWLPVEEDFVDVSLTPDDLQRLTENYDELSMYLGPYPSESHRDWVSLTSLVGPGCLTRLLPECGRIASCARFLSEPSSSQQRLQLKTIVAAGAHPEDLLPKLEIVPGTEVRFSKLPTKPMFPPNCDPREITMYGIDQTYTLNSVLHSLSPTSVVQSAECTINPTDWSKLLSAQERELLAELQFSYVVFLLNHLLDGWYHWRCIVHLLANCEQAVSLRPQLYLGVISVLYHQLCSASHSKDFLESDTADLSTAELADLFFSEVSSSGATNTSEPAFLPSTMRTLLRNILCSSDSLPLSDSQLHQELQKRAEGFCHSLQQRFHWDIRPDSLRNESKVADICVDDVDWNGDEAPVVVHM